MQYKQTPKNDVVNNCLQLLDLLVEECEQLKSLLKLSQQHDFINTEYILSLQEVTRSVFQMSEELLYSMVKKRVHACH